MFMVKCKKKTNNSNEVLLFYIYNMWEVVELREPLVLAGQTDVWY